MGIEPVASGHEVAHVKREGRGDVLHPVQLHEFAVSRLRVQAVRQDLMHQSPGEPSVTLPDRDGGEEHVRKRLVLWR